MQIAKVSSNTLCKTAFAPTERAQGRDGEAIARAIETSATSPRFGLEAMTTGDGQGGYLVNCYGRPGDDGEPIVDIIFKINRFGFMKGKVYRGMTMTHDFGHKLMNYILAEAVRTGGITAFQYDVNTNINAIANQGRTQPASVPNAQPAPMQGEQVNG